MLNLRLIRKLLLGALVLNLAGPAWAEGPIPVPTVAPAESEPVASQPDSEEVLTFAGEVAPPIPKLSEEEIVSIEKGEVITRTIFYRDSSGKKSGSAQAIAIIELPQEKAFAPAFDYGHFSEFMPRTEKVIIVRKETKNLWIVHYWIDVTLMTVEYELQLNHSFLNHWVEWRMNPEYEEPGIKDTTGYWAVYPWKENPNRSLMVYAARVDSGRSWIPDFVIDIMNKGGLPEVVENTRNRAMSGGTWKIGDEPPSAP